MQRAVLPQCHNENDSERRRPEVHGEEEGHGCCLRHFLRVSKVTLVSPMTGEAIHLPACVETLSKREA